MYEVSPVLLKHLQRYKKEELSEGWFQMMLYIYIELTWMSAEKSKQFGWMSHFN